MTRSSSCSKLFPRDAESRPMHQLLRGKRMYVYGIFRRAFVSLKSFPLHTTVAVALVRFGFLFPVPFRLPLPLSGRDLSTIHTVVLTADVFQLFIKSVPYTVRFMLTVYLVGTRYVHAVRRSAIIILRVRAYQYGVDPASIHTVGRNPIQLKHRKIKFQKRQDITRYQVRNCEDSTDNHTQQLHAL